MKTIGLTGGIGSGKSTVSDYFASLGVPIIDADIIAHQLVEKGKPALAEIESTFTNTVIDKNGNLDRATMRALIFNNPKLKEKLEAILHPLIYQEIKRQINQLNNTPAAQAPYCIIAIPLLTEKFALFGDLIDHIVVIDCSEELQLARIVARGKIAESEALAMIKAQATRESRLAIADEVIANAGSLKALKDRLSQLHKIWKTPALNV